MHGPDRLWWQSYFRPDSRLEPPFRSNLSDYSGSGYDRGHLAPAGDHKTTQANLTETFLLTNMAPQVQTSGSRVFPVCWVRENVLKFIYGVCGRIIYRCTLFWRFLIERGEF